MEFLARMLKSPGLFSIRARSDRTHPYVNIPTRNELYLVWNIYKLHIYMIFRIWILVFVWDISFHVVMLAVTWRHGNVFEVTCLYLRSCFTLWVSRDTHVASRAMTSRGKQRQIDILLRQIGSQQLRCFVCAIAKNLEKFTLYLLYTFMIPTTKFEIWPEYLYRPVFSW